MFAAILLSVALPCTAPPGLYASQPHSLIPREEASTWPQRERSFGCGFSALEALSKLSTWSDKNCSAIATSIFPFACFINSSQRACRAFGEEDASPGSKPLVSSRINLGSRAKFELTKYPSFVRHRG